VGLQLIGPMFGEANLLRIAYAYEQHRLHRRYPPGLSCTARPSSAGGWGTHSGKSARHSWPHWENRLTRKLERLII